MKEQPRTPDEVDAGMTLERGLHVRVSELDDWLGMRE
jgi:hypothetical protein